MKPPPSPEAIVAVRFVLGGLWVLVAAAVVGLPLATGRIRVGGPDATPIGRRSDPQGFWSTYAFSTGTFLAVSLGVAWFVAKVTSP